ncbi:MAG: D-cysteine desulfhydrase family protein [Anaerolineae bacterium]|nr:MAG: D-cysteine desulfhydrase family protein [Anaerolineae bacterium]
MLTDHLPRISLAHLPTPLEEMSRLREALGGGPHLLIKRDDQTGLATGGNKTRKLEFLVAEALAQEADTLITAGGPQSNHCRQTAAAAAKMGLRCVLVLSGEPLPRSHWNGNLLLDDLLGAEVHWAGNRDRAAAMDEVADALRTAGARPHVIPVGGSVPTGAAGYVAAIEEVAGQLATRDERVDRIVFASGSAGTHAGILVGVKALGLEARVEGINDDKVGGLREKIVTLAEATAARLGLDLGFSEGDFVLHDAYGAPGYGVITDAEREAIRLLAQTEGIIADPVYTGRALAGLIDLVRRDVYGPKETVLFWHTGGVAGLFPRAAELVS